MSLFARASGITTYQYLLLVVLMKTGLRVRLAPISPIPILDGQLTMQNPSIQEEYELSNISLAMRAKENEKNTSEQNIINAENGEMKDTAMDGGFDAWCTVVGG